MKKIVRLTEADLTKLVKRTINEMDEDKSEEYHYSLGNMMGHFYDNFNSIAHRYLDATYELSSDIENDDSLSDDDKNYFLTKLQQFENDLTSFVSKYKEFGSNDYEDFGNEDYEDFESEYYKNPHLK
jgi:hypothetical protein